MRSTLLLPIALCSVAGCTTPMVPAADAGSDAPRLPVDAPSVDAPSITDAPSIADAPSTLCFDYCGLVVMNCTGSNQQYSDVASCASNCSAIGWRDGTISDTTGNSIACRIYHASAASMDPVVHCPHAGPSGGGVCVDAP